MALTVSYVWFGVVRYFYFYIPARGTSWTVMCTGTHLTSNPEIDQGAEELQHVGVASAASPPFPGPPICGPPTYNTILVFCKYYVVQ